MHFVVLQQRQYRSQGPGQGGLRGGRYPTGRQGGLTRSPVVFGRSSDQWCLRLLMYMPTMLHSTTRSKQRGCPVALCSRDDNRDRPCTCGGGDSGGDKRVE